VVWSRERPLGLGAQHFVNLIAKGRAPAGECSPKTGGI
jgi:hypothetical protein